MELQNFSLEEAHRIYSQSVKVDKVVQVNGKKMVVEEIDPKACQDYIAKYFYPMIDSSHFFWMDNKFIHMSNEDVKKVYFNRLPDDISKWYFKKYNSLCKVINDIHKPQFEAGKINLCPGLKHKTTKKYADFSPAIKEKVKLFLSYIKEVLCDNNIAAYEYILKWESFLCKGKKNDTLLYFKGTEGIGKSTHIELLIKYVLGLLTN